MTENTQTESDGIIAALAELPPDALIDEAGLMRIFGRCAKSIKRAVTRNELPRPVRLFGKPTWTAGAILSHLNSRLDEAKKDAERLAKRISQLSA
jgi:hypothetical protein